MGFNCYDLSAGLHLVVHDAQNPTEAEWATMGEIVRRLGSDRFRTLVVSDGGAPTVQQLRKLDSLMTALSAPPRTAVITGSTAMRAVVSAAGWVSKNQLKAYKPADAHEAFRFLDMTPAEVSRMQHAIDIASKRFELKLFDQVVKRAG